jgi:putative ABC transport system ATP-binding protein
MAGLTLIDVVAFVFLLISSSITMSIPYVLCYARCVNGTDCGSFSIGKILDAATKADGGDLLFGLTIPQFYGALAAVCTVMLNSKAKADT